MRWALEKLRYTRRSFLINDSAVHVVRRIVDHDLQRRRSEFLRVHQNLVSFELPVAGRATQGLRLPCHHRWFTVQDLAYGQAECPYFSAVTRRRGWTYLFHWCLWPGRPQSSPHGRVYGAPGNRQPHSRGLGSFSGEIRMGNQRTRQPSLNSKEKRRESGHWKRNHQD